MRRGLLCVALLGAACGGADTATTTPTTWAGDQSVHAEIEASSDCAWLQEKFDTAAANTDRYEPGHPMRTVTVAFMKHADERMEKVGCYR